MVLKRFHFTLQSIWDRVDECLKAHAQIVHKFREMLSRSHGNSEEQNKFLEPSIIMTNYCVTINAYDKYDV